MEAVDDSPEVIILSEGDLAIKRNGEFVDVRMHDDSRPDHWPTIFASLTLDGQSARRVATNLIDVSGPSVDDVVQRVLNETRGGAIFDLSAALRLAAGVPSPVLVDAAFTLFTIHLAGGRHAGCGHLQRPSLSPSQRRERNAHGLLENLDDEAAPEEAHALIATDLSLGVDVRGVPGE